MNTTNIRLLEDYLEENKALNHRLEAVRICKLRKKQQARQQQAVTFDPLIHQGSNE